jgi:uncharacterized protein (TIGR00369 family)
LNIPNMRIPEGFEPLFRTSPVLGLIGPVYCRGKGPELVLGMRAETKHCNARGTVHGGVLATLADVALGYTMAFSSDPPASLATASLNLDFAGSAKPDDWLETRVDIQRQGSRLAFANCYIWVGSQRIVRASGVYVVAGSLRAGESS